MFDIRNYSQSTRTMQINTQVIAIFQYINSRFSKQTQLVVIPTRYSYYSISDTWYSTKCRW